MKMDLLEKLCNLMIGFDNLSGKLVYADKILTKKPQTLGEGLARIKNKFGIIEQKEPLMANTRRYIAKDGSNVHFNNFSSALSIKKEVQPVSGTTYNKVFSNELAEVHKNYMNINLGDKVHLDRSIDVSYFKPLKVGNIKDKIATHNIDRPCVQELKYNDFNHDHYHNTREIPYAKACTMGLKV